MAARAANRNGTGFVNIGINSDSPTGHSGSVLRVEEHPPRAGSENLGNGAIAHPNFWRNHAEPTCRSLDRRDDRRLAGDPVRCDARTIAFSPGLWSYRGEFAWTRAAGPARRFSRWGGGERS